MMIEARDLYYGWGRLLAHEDKHHTCMMSIAAVCWPACMLCCIDTSCLHAARLPLQQYHKAARLLQERGLRGPSRLKFLVEEGAGHHEGAWRWRLSGALQFLAHGWWDS